LRKFVEAGGTLVFLNRASNFAIEQFNLPVKDVTQGLNRKDFFIPGSILRTELDTTHPIAKGMPAQSIAWFENSPAFEIKTDPLALDNNFKIIARYPTKTERHSAFRLGFGRGKTRRKSRARRIYNRQRQNRFVRLSPAISRSIAGDVSAFFNAMEIFGNCKKDEKVSLVILRN
jgi:hypothetical protein